MLEQIRLLLEKDPRITDWEILESHHNGHQIYTSLGEQEAVRAIEQRRWQVGIYTDVPVDGKPPLMGYTSIEIVEGENNPSSRIDAAIEQAKLHGSQRFKLPSAGLEYPVFDGSDPGIRDDPWNTLEHLKDELHEAVSKEEHINVASSEFFLDHTDFRFINSCGIDLNDANSKFTWDICLLFNDGKSDTEFWEMKFRPGARYVNIKDDVARYAKYARDAAIAQVPKSGNCPVVITGDHLYILLQYFLHHSSASARYNGSSMFEPGKPVLPRSPDGDLLSITSNALHKGGFRSYRFDSQGTPGKCVPIIENGILTRFWAPIQYAQYLGIDTTGVFGNFDLPPGKISWNDLFKSDDRVILVQQFSTFDPQPVAGNYLGEIRVGYEFRRDGTVIPLRGGSVTGNVVDGMLDCRFCREIETFYGYVGPRGIRFEHAQVAGE